MTLIKYATNLMDRHMKTITRKMIIPDWSMWIAQDCLGYCYVFEFVPVEGQGGWEAPDGKKQYMYDSLPKNNWQKTLQRI